MNANPMASEEHQELARFIKNVHKTLRMRAREVGASRAWKEHCQQKEMLYRYAETMHTLATEHWDKNSGEKASSRIQWVVEQSVKYFMNGGRYIEYSKEMKKIEHNEHLIEPKDNDSNELKLLDVGSCYNPFKNIPFFKVLPIDLNPACNDVFKADFLNLSMSPSTIKIEDIIKKLPISNIPVQYFDVVVFSLLLEYMPSPHQRFLCCKKAYDALKEEGLLFIISPDSKHSTANASLMRKWRICLAQIGFTRIVYEKLSHLHCMVFRKNCHIFVSQRWAERVIARESKLLNYECDANSPDCSCSLLRIPQDDTEYRMLEVNEEPERSVEDNLLIVDMFQELPEDIEL